MLELWISIISITDLWIALIEEWISIKGLSFLPFHDTEGLLSSDLVAFMFWGPFHQMIFIPWWPHQMGTSSALLALCVGNSPVTGTTWSFDAFFDLRLNKRLSKQSRRRWFETPSRSLWHHCNYMHISSVIEISISRISFSGHQTGHQNKFCACLDSIYGSRVILVMCKNCSDISWHRLNLNQSKTNCLKNLNSDGFIVWEMCPWSECIFRSLLQFLVYSNQREPPRNRYKMSDSADGIGKDWIFPRITN